MNSQQRDALRNARDRIQEFNEECEAAEYTETGEAWEVLEQAYNAIDALFTPTKEPDAALEVLRDGGGDILGHTVCNERGAIIEEGGQ